MGGKLSAIFSKFFKKKQYVHSPRNKVSYDFRNTIKSLLTGKHKKKK